MMRSVAIGLVLATVPVGLVAQNSVYGTRGVGFPGRAVSSRTIALGGGTAMFDRASPLNPAVVVLFRTVTVGAVTGSTFREYDALGAEVTGLKETRFPRGFVGGGIARSPFSFNLGFSAFAERTFDLETSGTIVADGESVDVTDRIVSDGGIVDVRAAIGYLASPTLGLGGAFHLLAGSSRVEATREFSSSRFRTFEEQDDLSFSGTGFSAGLAWWARSSVHVGLMVRANTDLRTRLGDGSSEDVSMPWSVAAGVSLGPTSGIRLSSTGRWRSWSRVAGGAAAPETRAFDTFEIGTGLELGSSARFPLRFGVRYAQLPFSPSDEQPHEWNFSFGTGTPFAANRAALDLAIVRLQRDGAGATERGWYFVVGITVSPGL